MDFGQFERDIRARTIPTLIDFAETTHGNRPFLRETGSGAWLSFAEAAKRSRALASGLQALGVKPGDILPLMLPNCIEYMLAWFAVNLSGGCYISVNTSLVGDLLARQLSLSTCPVWFVHVEHLQAIQALPDALRASVRTLVIVGDVPEGATPPWAQVVAFDNLIGDATFEPRKAHFLDLAAITFTSGTTGPSKGVMVTQAQGVSSALTFSRLVGLTPDDVLYTPLPLFHGLSSRMGMLPAMLTGCRMVLGKRFSGSRFWNEVIEADATVAQIIFSMPAVLLKQPPGQQDRGHRVTRMFNAHYTEGFEERFGAKLVEAFGISEVGLFIASAVAEQRPGSAGRAHPDWDVAVLDPDGFSVPDGEAGEICCRPRQPGLMMRGYINQADRVVEATRELWYHTGDIGLRDADGYFWFLDRAKERIRRRGENISSLEIESCVRAHADVADVTAIAHPAKEGEDDIRLLIVPQPGASIVHAAFHGWLSTNLPRFMVPRYIEIVASLPYTATNKIEKARLMAAGLGPDTWDAETAAAVPLKSAHGT